jgi:hypothetical protein
MSQSDYIKNKKIVLQLQKQSEIKPILDSSFYTLSKAHSIELDISNTILTYSQLTPAKAESKCEKFITCSNTNLRPNRMTFVRRMVNDYKPFVKQQKLGIYNKYCYDSSHNLINTNNTNRLFSAYGNKRLRDICNYETKLNIVVKVTVVGLPSTMTVEDTVFKFRNSRGALISPKDANIGGTYSLYSETDHTVFNIWLNSIGDQMAMMLGQFDAVANNKFSNLSHTFFDIGDFDSNEPGRLDLPVPIDYSLKFVLDYGTIFLYIYGMDGTNTTLFSPSTLFAYFSITVTKIL